MKHIVFFLTAALLLNASCGSSDEGGKTDPPAAPVPVAPTTELGKADEAIENLQLKPGKLISINQVNAANCRRAVAAGMCIDIMASDKIVFASDMTDERLDGLFAECGEAIRSTKADFWGLHLPYQTYDISSTNENTRVTAVLKLKRLIELTIEHLRPQHFVIHPNTGTILTTGGDFAERTAQSRKSLAELQRHIESCNAQHGTKAILCVENCARSLAYDGDSLLDLLDAEGLEKVRVCLDTGHALIPLNGKYIDPVRNGDALDVLRRIGTRLGTLHIQQNPGALDPTDPKDKHLEPFSGGLIDWGEFYYELLKNNRYRGCFLYEVSFKQVYDGDSSTIESAKSNYTNLIYPAFVRTVAAIRRVNLSTTGQKSTTRCHFVSRIDKISARRQWHAVCSLACRIPDGTGERRHTERRDEVPDTRRRKQCITK